MRIFYFIFHEHCHVNFLIDYGIKASFSSRPAALFTSGAPYAFTT